MPWVPSQVEWLESLIAAQLHVVVPVMVGFPSTQYRIASCNLDANWRNMSYLGPGNASLSSCTLMQVYHPYQAKLLHVPL